MGKAEAPSRRAREDHLCSHRKAHRQGRITQFWPLTLPSSQIGTIEFPINNPEHKATLEALREQFSKGWKGALPPGVANHSDLPRGDDSWYSMSKQKQATAKTPKTKTQPKGLGETSENKPWIKSFFEKNPQADTDGNGVLTKGELTRFRDSAK